MSLSLSRILGPAILTCLAAVSPVRGQDEATSSSEAAVPQQSGTAKRDASAIKNPSSKAKDESPQEDLLASLGVRLPPDVLALAEISRRVRLSIWPNRN